MIKPKKEKKCQNCGKPFMPFNSIEKWCSPDCGYALHVKNEAKKERKKSALRKQALKPRREWLADAQVAFNAYIRYRDRGQRCICCDRPLVEGLIGGGYDCGHYRSVGSAPHLRFDERNAHGQTKQCNRYGSGRAVDYRIGLIRRIGLAEVESLEADQTPKHYTIDDLKQIKARYIQKRKDLINGES